MGRPAKPVAQLKLNGSYRADRHRHRENEPLAGGSPKVPKWLSKDARKVWREIVPMVEGLNIAVGEADSEALGSMCNWLSIYRELAQKVAADADFSSREVIAMSCAWKQGLTVMSKFGLTPADRIRLATPEPKPVGVKPRAR